MDFAFPATTTAAAATAAEELPFPRFAAASPPCFPPPAPALAEAGRAAAAVMAEEGPRAPGKRTGAGAGADDAASAAAAAEVEDRMDLLWEDFNEELALARRRARGRGGSWRERGEGLLVLEAGPWSSPSSPSDAGSEPAGRVGCAPVLRPSSRAAGGARHCRRRAGSWVLLMRIFRRLFVIDKTISVARQRSTTRAR
ncbi:vasodilator-stimulated phosphoprotein-like [Panicum miliaceum]|uniref:Vasodilator-stimulated phosphoprotein-like n=1 Tax=Panicum miliaceum TaxID=4540 RepID=A0A3L6Q965_PANMI|nr:vasodilator-stimulated phosphoprotein-like [Panicum miliaceum]